MSRNNHDVSNAILIIGNLAVLGLFAYIVFWMGNSGWWMLFPLVFHFSRTKGLGL